MAIAGVQVQRACTVSAVHSPALPSNPLYAQLRAALPGHGLDLCRSHLPAVAVVLATTICGVATASVGRPGIRICAVAANT